MNVFDSKLINSMKDELPTYAIGVDRYDGTRHTYCLTKFLNGKMEILLLKTLPKETFEDEITNLAKYFDAEICEETPEKSKGKVSFVKGKFTTSDPELIEELKNHPRCKKQTTNQK